MFAAPSSNVRSPALEVELYFAKDPIPFSEPPLSFSSVGLAMLMGGTEDNLGLGFSHWAQGFK